MTRTNHDGVTAKERAELRDILADPNSRNRDIQAAQQRLRDLEKRRR